MEDFQSLPARLVPEWGAAHPASTALCVGCDRDVTLELLWEMPPLQGDVWNKIAMFTKQNGNRIGFKCHREPRKGWWCVQHPSRV